MVMCSKCGHHNLPSFPTCTKCGTPLPPAPPGFDLSGKPKKAGTPLYAGIVALALAAVVFVYMRDKRAKAELQTKLDWVDRWAAVERDDVGAFWNCVMITKTDIGRFGNANQVQGQMELAYASEPQSYGAHLTDECLPKLERARRAADDLPPPPAELAPAIDAWKKTLPPLGTGIEGYVAKLGARKGGKDFDALIQDYGDKWHAEDKPTPETVAFEKFIHCAVPGLAKMKNAQAMLEYLAEACFRKDAAVFMGHARDACGKLLFDTGSSTPSKTWSSSKRFYEQEARQMQAWSSCSKRARKGLRNDDLGPLLAALGPYMKARADVAKAGRALNPP